MIAVVSISLFHQIKLNLFANIILKGFDRRTNTDYKHVV